MAPRFLIALACLVAAVSMLMPLTALADGDPASDYLYTGTVFTPAGTHHTQVEQLRNEVTAANSAGESVRVAVVGSPYDLGSVTALWAKPRIYARFLGAELSSRYRGLVLVVMPAGLGLYRHGHSVSRQQAALAGIHPRAGTAQLIRTAEAAVAAVSAADGYRVAVPPAASSRVRNKSASSPRNWIGLGLLAAGLLLVLVAVGVAAIAHRGGRRRPRRPSGRTLATAAWLVAAVAVMVVGIRHFAASEHETALASQTPATPFTWRAGAFPAPDFALRDQNGAPVSIAGSAGTVRIVAFIDPVCRNFCPREASILGAAERTLGKRPAPIYAISVNPWDEAHKTLVTDDRHWRVGPAWHWAIGDRRALQRVWAGYKVGVRVSRVRVNGVLIRSITHDELIYVVDRNGDIRALLPYPFTATAVVQTVRALQQS